jgi:predicted small lipoprotein YifL
MCGTDLAGAWFFSYAAVSRYHINHHTVTQLHSPTFTMHSFKRIAFVVVVLASTYTLASCGQKGPLQLSVSAATGPASALNVPA